MEGVLPVLRGDLDRAGRFAVGAPEAMITETYLRQTYQVAARVVALDRPDGSPRRLCLPLGRASG